MNNLSVRTKALIIFLVIMIFASFTLANNSPEGISTNSGDKKTTSKTTPTIASEDKEDDEQTANAGEDNAVPWASYGVAYIGEIVSLLTGDQSSSAMIYLDNLDLSLEISTEGLGLFPGGTLFFQILGNNGADPTSFVGDTQVTSNIEANNTQRLYQAWYNHEIMGGAVEVLVGMHDLNSEFYTSEYAGFFNNSSFGIGPDMSANAPIGIFNLAAVGARIKVAPGNGLTILAAVYDGDPGDPDINTNGIKFEWAAEEGLMSIAEVQYEMQTIQHPDADPSIVRLGGWFHSADFTTINLDSIATISGNYGIYYSIDYPLSKNLGAFVHGGFAAGSRSAIPAYTGFGFQTLRGSRFIFTPKIKQTFGLAVASAYVAEEGKNEMVIELTWHLQLTDMLTIKPDLQYVLNPSGDASAAPALVFSLRTEIGF